MVGDLSSAGHFLAYGFRDIGIDVTHVAYQNGWRNNPVEINLTSPFGGVRGRLHNYMKPLALGSLVGYDAILFLDYFTFPRTFGINSYVTNKIKDNNGDAFLWLLGCDSQFAKWGKVHNFELCNPCLLYDQMELTCKCEKDEAAEGEFLKSIKAVIPGSYEYYESHKGLKNLTKPIQMPVMIDEGLATRAPSNSNINVFHGLNRYGFKGTYIVEKVFSTISDQYKNRFDFTIKGHLPYKDYIELLANQHIVVDQLFNKTLGINSLLTLASGKVLVAGDPTLGCEAYGIPLPPMVTSESSVAGFERCMRNLLDNYQDVRFNPDYARSYIESYHSPKLVAQKFAEVFKW